MQTSAFYVGVSRLLIQVFLGPQSMDKKRPCFFVVRARCNKRFSPLLSPTNGNAETFAFALQRYNNFGILANRNPKRTNMDFAKVRKKLYLCKFIG